MTYHQQRPFCQSQPSSYFYGQQNSGYYCPPQRFGGGGGKTCLFCGKDGHAWADCYRRQRELGYQHQPQPQQFNDGDNKVYTLLVDIAQKIGCTGGVPAQFGAQFGTGGTPERALSSMPMMATDDPAPAPQETKIC